MRYTLYSPNIAIVDTSGGDQNFATSAVNNLRGVDIFAPGTFHFTDSRGVEATVTFPTVANGGCYPTRYIVQIAIIHDDCSIADSNMLGLL